MLGKSSVHSIAAGNSWPLVCFNFMSQMIASKSCISAIYGLKMYSLYFPDLINIKIVQIVLWKKTNSPGLSYVPTMSTRLSWPYCYFYGKYSGEFLFPVPPVHLFTTRTRFAASTESNYSHFFHSQKVINKFHSVIFPDFIYEGNFFHLSSYLINTTPQRTE